MVDKSTKEKVSATKRTKWDDPETRKRMLDGMKRHVDKVMKARLLKLAKEGER